MKKYNVLLVDDSRVVHVEMINMLADSEFQIHTYCRSGEDALDAYADAAPDLVLMDIVMAGMCGLEASKKNHVSVAGCPHPRCFCPGI